MKRVSMSGSLRENVGKKDAKALRAGGRVPCVLYGGKEQIHFSLETKAFKPLIQTPDAAFAVISLDGKDYETILQDIQFHPVSDNIYHADFLELVSDKEITMSIPVVVKGSSIGVIKGGKLIKKQRRLKVRSFPEDMIDTITLDISKLNIDDSITVGEIKTEKVRLLDNPNSIVVMVKTSRVVVVPSEEEDEDSGEAAE